MTADDQRSGLDIVHRHPAEGLPDIDRRSQRIRLAVGALWIHVDQAHLRGTERSTEFPLPGVPLVAKPGFLGTPVNLVGLPDVLAAEAESERREPHRFISTVAGEDDQIGPGDLAAILLLN